MFIMEVLRSMMMIIELIEKIRIIAEK